MNTPMSAPSRKRVTIVDDDETALLMAEEVLSSQGFQVLVFADPLEALQVTLLDPPDILVLDVLMPGMDGFEFCRRLRAHPSGQDVPVLMTTSLDDPSSIDRAYAAGATDFDVKPLNWFVETHRLRYMLRAAETARLLKAREQETRLAKEDWERTFNSFSDVVTLLSPDLRILRANSATAAALGRPLEAIIGNRCHQLFQDSDLPCPGCPIVRSIETGAPVTGEVRYRNPPAECLLTGSPVTDKDGKLLHIVHLARDLTEQKQLEIEYRHAQKMEAMGTLAGGIAHDFNNMLTVIFCSGELLRDDPDISGHLRDYADAVLEAAKRGATLAGQLLTFSRKGAARTEKGPLDFGDVARDVQKMLRRVLPKNINVQTHLGIDLRRLNASSDQLYQVMMNLAVNASHAMPSGGTLTIEARNVHLDHGDVHLSPDIQPGDFVLITVSDTGTGMDAKTLQRIYEPFFTTKRVGEGTGLGLSVVYGIVKGHAGHILCYSELGVGTTFKIYLPALPESEETTLVRSRASSPPPRGSEAILVVDDEGYIRNLLRTALTKMGYQVILAVDGESALQRFQDESARIRLVLLDLGMPGMGGWECLKRLRVVGPTLPVLITTGYGGEDLHQRARDEGAVGVIGKPYEVDALYRRIREVLDSPLPFPTPRTAVHHPTSEVII